VILVAGMVALATAVPAISTAGHRCCGALQHCYAEHPGKQNLFRKCDQFSILPGGMVCKPESPRGWQMVEKPGRSTRWQRPLDERSSAILVG
jgi:hypothetical protein